MIFRIKNLFLFIAVLAIFSFYIFSKILVIDDNNSSLKVDAVIVFGFPAHDNGTISEMQRTRMDKGSEHFKKQNAKYLITAGGAAYNKYVEADVMKNYAILKGIEASQIYAEGESKSTIENTRNILKLIEQENLEIKRVVIVSSAFHTHRITNLMKANCDLELITVAAKYPDILSFVELGKALVREIIGWFYHLIFGYDL